jgi:hypothetical protein
MNFPVCLGRLQLVLPDVECHLHGKLLWRIRDMLWAGWQKHSLLLRLKLAMCFSRRLQFFLDLPGPGVLVLPVLPVWRFALQHSLPRGLGPMLRSDILVAVLLSALPPSNVRAVIDREHF